MRNSECGIDEGTRRLGDTETRGPGPGIRAEYGRGKGKNRASEVTLQRAQGERRGSSERGTPLAAGLVASSAERVGACRA